MHTTPTVLRTAYIMKLCIISFFDSWLILMFVYIVCLSAASSTTSSTLCTCHSLSFIILLTPLTPLLVLNCCYSATTAITLQAGPGTIAEATIRGLPIMLSGYLPGQEEGNVPYVVDGGFGSFSKNPAVIANTVSNWLLDEQLLAKMSAAAKKAARPTATFDIAREIGAMLFTAEATAVAAQQSSGSSSAVDDVAARVHAGGAESE
jgi:hypothetical protein